MLMDLIKLGTIGVGYPILDGYQINYEKIDGSGTKRNIYGTMRRQVIANKIKIELSFVANLTEQELRPILNYLNQDAFEATYWDAKTGSYKTSRFYSSTPELDLEYIKGGSLIYKPFKVRVIEL